jgi:hypothetical protein
LFFSSAEPSYVSQEEIDLIPHAADRDQLELAPGRVHVPQRRAAR